jgi:hypothetical protein
VGLVYRADAAEQCEPERRGDHYGQGQDRDRGIRLYPAEHGGADHDAEHDLEHDRRQPDPGKKPSTNGASRPAATTASKLVNMASKFQLPGVTCLVCAAW